MHTYRIYPLLVGTTRRSSTHVYYGYSGAPEREMTIPLIAWYATDGDRHIVVDTAGTAPDGVRHMPYCRTPGQSLDRALARLGVRCEEVSVVILTHLHWDHAGNNHLFPNARFYVQGRELRSALSPSEAHRPYYDSETVKRTAYIEVDGDATVLPGVSVLLVPGHSEGSQAVLFETARGIYAVAGDLVSNYLSWELSPRLISGVHTDEKAYRESYERLDKRAGFILPGHDMQVFAQSVYP